MLLVHWDLLIFQLLGTLLGSPRREERQLRVWARYNPFLGVCSAPPT